MQQLIEHLFRILALTAMHRRYLNRGAARGNQPVKTFPLRKLTDRTSIRSPFANSRDSRKMCPDGLNIQSRIKRQKPLLINLDSGPEEFLCRARHYDSNVYELFAFNPWNYTKDGVVILKVIVHGSPPPRTHAAQSAYSANTYCKHFDKRRHHQMMDRPHENSILTTPRVSASVHQK